MDAANRSNITLEDNNWMQRIRASRFVSTQAKPGNCIMRLQSSCPETPFVSAESKTNSNLQSVFIH